MELEVQAAEQNFAVSPRDSHMRVDNVRPAAFLIAAATSSAGGGQRSPPPPAAVSFTRP